MREKNLLQLRNRIAVHNVYDFLPYNGMTVNRQYIIYGIYLRCRSEIVSVEAIIERSERASGTSSLGPDDNVLGERVSPSLKGHYTESLLQHIVGIFRSLINFEEDSKIDVSALHSQIIVFLKMENLCILCFHLLCIIIIL